MSDYNMAMEAAQLQIKYDSFYAEKSDELIDKTRALNGQISDASDIISHLLTELRKDPSKPIDLSAFQQQIDRINENLPEVEKQVRHGDPDAFRFETQIFPNDISEINSNDVEKIIGRLEGFKMRGQNEIPNLMTEMQKFAQLLMAFTDISRKSVETEIDARADILRKMLPR